MKLIRPSAEIWEQDSSLDGVWEHIARCTRVCYQSTPKNDGETDEEFVKRVILRHEPWNSEANHLSMLEHGTIYLEIYCYNGCEDDNYYKIINYRENKYSIVNNVFNGENIAKNFAITTNLRVLIENNWLDDLQFICAPTEHHAKRVTVSFTTNIGVSREFNRHRVNSMAEESTRYCNYNKRNKEHINICLPSWISEADILNYKRRKKEHPNIEYTPLDYYILAIETCEKCYNSLIAMGWKPQQAREVLPLATKTQLIHTAFVDDWIHFIRLRAEEISGPSHPNAKLVAIPLKEQFLKLGYIKI